MPVTVCRNRSSCAWCIRSLLALANELRHKKLCEQEDSDALDDALERGLSNVSIGTVVLAKTIEYDQVLRLWTIPAAHCRQSLLLAT